MNYQILLTFLTILISILALYASRRANIYSKEALMISKRAEHRTNLEYLDSIPSIDLLEVVEIKGKKRVKVLLTNMRDKPFRINSLRLTKKSFKKKNIMNHYLSIFDPNFDWNFDLIDGYFWNPKGELDDDEHYIKDAGKYSVVKDSEIVMVTIPDFSQYTTYNFVFNTSHGNVSLLGRVSESGKVHFSNEFRKWYY